MNEKFLVFRERKNNMRKTRGLIYYQFDMRTGGGT